MKKILAVSLCAIMAVSVARADIASVEYVDEQITGASSTINSTINTLTQTVGTKAAQADLTTLQNTVTTNESDIEGKVSALSQTVTDNKATADKTQQDLETLEATVAGLQGTGETAAATKGELNALGGRVDDAEGEIDALQASLATGGDTQKAIVAAQTQADKGVADAAAAQAAASAAQATADKAVVANDAITAGTATKITYDAKGLVTKGEALTATDIPTIPSTKVSGLGTLASKDAVGSAEITDGAVALDDLAANSVNSAKIVNGTVAKEDLVSEVQTSLGKADTAVQPSAISDMQTKSNRLTTADTTSITDANKDTLYPTVGRTTQMINELSTNVTTNIDSLNTALTTLSNNTTTALSGKQTKSTAAYQMGGANGTWTTMTEAQQAALNSTATTTKINQIGTNTTAINAIKNASTLTEGEGDGQYALTMTKSGDTITYKWEMIGR